MPAGRMPEVVTAIAAVLLLVCAGSAAAATRTFDGGTDGNRTVWDDAVNWSPNTTPTADDDTVIPAGFHPVVTVVDRAANSIELHGTLTIRQGRKLTIDGGAASSLGGAVTVMDGGVLELDGATTWSADKWTIGGGAATSGTVQVDGALTVSVGDLVGEPAVAQAGGGLLDIGTGGSL